MSGVVGWGCEGYACQPDLRRCLVNDGDEVADLSETSGRRFSLSVPNSPKGFTHGWHGLGFHHQPPTPRATACSWSAALGVPPPLARVTCFRISQPSCGTASGRLRRERIGSVTAVPSVSHLITVRVAVAIRRAADGPTELPTDTEVAP
jgi:hypothetical protein